MITWGPLDNPGSSFYLKILNQTTKALVPREVTYLQVQGIHGWTSLGRGVIQPLTGTHLMKWDTTR